VNNNNPILRQTRPHIVMTLFGRCGSFFVHSLFDGHPLLSSIPGVAPTTILRMLTNNPQLALMPTQDLANWVTQAFDFYFNTAPFREKAGFDRMGDNTDEVLSIDINTFQRYLLESLIKREGMAFFSRLDEAMHDAFDLTVNGNTRPRIFFHAHPLSHEFARLLLTEIPDHRQFLLLREPVENIESCVNAVPQMDSKKKRRLPFFYGNVRDMVACQADSASILDDRSVAVRLEDIKAQPEVTLRALCEALALPFDSALLQSSFMGKAYSSVPTLRNPHIKGFENPANAPQGYRLSQKDRAFFATLFSGIRHWAEYKTHETLDEKEMRAIVDGALLDVEVDIATSEGIAKEALRNDDRVIAFRQFLAGIPNIFNGPPAKLASRLITNTTSPL
jgi:Sulfotransferase family